MVESLNSAMDAVDDSMSGPRENQLCAFVGVDNNMNIIYSHYSKTMADFPDIKDIIKMLRK